jgi:AraC-like DNA-binding protein
MLDRAPDAARSRRLIMDALSELLRAVKLSGALFFDADCSAPWCVRSPSSRTLGHVVNAPEGHVIEFHLIAEGCGYIRVGGETTPLTAGDVVIIPHGDPHDMGNGHGCETIDSQQALPGILRGEIRQTRIGGGGEPTRLICGYLACEANLVAPLLAGLPRVVRVHLRSDAYGSSLEGMVRHAVDQHETGLPGSDVIVARLAEVVFAEALRRYVLQLAPQRAGWLAAAADPAVGRALTQIHRRPAHPWTLDELALAAALSRSSLAERFTRYLGQGPIAYLTEWRLHLAAESLRATSRSVLQIAGDVGYESEAAFNRAFKRRFSLPPARYRKSWREEKRTVRRPSEENASDAASRTVTSDSTDPIEFRRRRSGSARREANASFSWCAIGADLLGTSALMAAARGGRSRRRARRVRVPAEPRITDGCR